MAKVLNKLSQETKEALANQFGVPLGLLEEMYVDEFAARRLSDGKIEKELVLRSSLIFEQCSNEEKEPWED